MNTRLSVALFLLLCAIHSDHTQASEFRSLTGDGNNLEHSNWGAAGQNLLRITSAAYSDGVSSLRGGPNVRTMSNHVYAQRDSLPDENNLSQFSWAWGQFLAHDTDLTPLQEGAGAEHIDVAIPVDDGVFNSSQAIPVTRSVFDSSTGMGGQVREHPNVISSFIDGSMVYGGASDENNRGQDRADWLRDPLNPARLRVSSHATGDLLPQKGTDANAPGMAMDSKMGASTFVAGDRRANEHAVLTTMHTLFVREHNRIADILLGSHDTSGQANAAGLTVDDYVYERARKVVGAEIQAITYNEYLPTLGVGLSPYTGYDNSVNPSVSPEFAVAAFRLGHTQVNGVVPRLDALGNPTSHGELDLIQAFFDPTSVTDEGGIDPVLRGLAASVQEATDAKMRDGLRNLLFGPPTAGPVANGSDLAALNTIRGRDHGLPTFKDAWIELIGIEGAPESFADMTPDTDVQAALTAVYGTIDEVDLWVGLLCEQHAPNESVGTLTELILADQFERLRDGDRFYFANDLDLQSWKTFDDDLTDAEWLGQLSLSDVILANTGVESIQRNVFDAKSVPEPSSLHLAWGMLCGFLLLSRTRRSASHTL